MSTYLEDLIRGSYRRVEQARAAEPLASLRARAQALPPPPSFIDALSGPGVAVIAEVKRASPSKGPLAPGIDAKQQARAYLDAGASAVSVLTEPDRFDGSLTDLAEVASLGRPSLRKDFLVDPYQVWEARLAGASAILLIVAALDEATLVELHEEAQQAGLAALVEIHDEAEVERAHQIGARVVGINARDLRTFEMDHEAFARLRPRLPQGCIAIAESGITGPDDVRRAARKGADAVLVGQTAVTATDPRQIVAALVEAGRDELAPDGAAKLRQRGK